VIGDDDHAVGALDCGLQRHRLEPELAQPRHVRIVVAHRAALGAQQLDQLERRRLAGIVDVRLVGDADDEHL
jgi:hypothetical protein